MAYDDDEGYDVRAQKAAHASDDEGCQIGIKQSIDDKTVELGLGAFDPGKQKA